MKIALTNVRVFDGRCLVPGSTVVIEDALIGSDPAGARRVDGARRVLLPGLIDAHVHIDRPQHLAALASHGVTTALDMASVPGVIAPLRGLAGQTDIRSACIPAIAPGSLHASFPGVGPAGLIGGPDEARQFVADRVAEGADYIKIVIGSPFADHEQATIDALVAAAHERGTPHPRARRQRHRRQAPTSSPTHRWTSRWTRPPWRRLWRPAGAWCPH
jgi:cytosine/adenosine deaminase-related metal-dependent hydrolase